MIFNLFIPMDSLVRWMLLVLVGYLLGTIPFGVVVSMVMRLPDPRTVGSKNVGFTNMLRVFGSKAGILTLIGDLGKGLLVSILASQLVEEEWMILSIAFAPFLGHVFPIFVGFNGGKGVATAFGAVLGVSLFIGLILLLIWFGTVALSRYSSVGALSAFVSFPLIVVFTDSTMPFIFFAVLMSGCIVMKHKENIERLLNGLEPKIKARTL